MIHTRFLSPTDQKCVESSTYWQFFYYRPPGKFWFTHLGEIVKMLCQELDIHIYVYIYIYDALDNRYGFSISVQPGIDCTTFQFLFMKSLKKKRFFKIFKSWQVCDWLAKWMSYFINSCWTHYLNLVKRLLSNPMKLQVCTCHNNSAVMNCAK